MVSFINSHAQSYQLEPMNSYYRLLAHQLAEYHGLKHTLAQGNDTCIVVFKDDTFGGGMNKPLLQELDPPRQYQYNAPFYPPNHQNHKKFKILRRDSQSEEQHIPSIQNSNAEENQRTGITQQQYDRHKSEIFSEPTTPQKSTKAVEDDSPQPHQFETSRYKFKQQSYKPKKKKFHKKSNSFQVPQYYYPPPAPFQMPYMMYNPYAMMYVPPEHTFAQLPPQMHKNNPYMYAPIQNGSPFYSPGSPYSSKNSSNVSLKKKDRRSNSRTQLGNKSSDSLATDNTRDSLMDPSAPNASAATPPLEDMSNQLGKLSI